MNRLALDPGPAHTGYAVEVGGEVVSYGTRRFRDLERGRHINWEAETADGYARWLTWIVGKEEVGEVVVEETFHGARSSPDLRWVGWAHISTALLCHRLKIEYRPVASSVFKAFATGSGKTKPAGMIKAAKVLGFLDVSDDHMADAIFMLLCTAKGALPGPLGRADRITPDERRRLRA